MPPARDLAAVLGVSAHTVFRALRDEGILEFSRVEVARSGKDQATVARQAMLAEHSLSARAPTACADRNDSAALAALCARKPVAAMH
jgi:DNA-binding transcriptional regulator YhcF (GntR family)